MLTWIKEIINRLKLDMSTGAEMINKTLGTIMMGTGMTSMVDSFEQALRIILLLISIATGIMFIIINHKKVIKMVRQWLHSCPED
jgi:hypothetical protein